MLDSQYYTECISASINVLMKHNELKEHSHLQAKTNWEELLYMLLSSEKRGDNGPNTSTNARL